MPNHLWMQEEHHAFATSVRRFFDDEFQPHRDQWKDEGLVPKEFWTKAGDIGILGATIPEEFGGLGLSRHFDAVTFLEQAQLGASGRGCSVPNIATHCVTAFGTEQQKAKWLPQMASGEMVAAIAMMLSSGGSFRDAVRYGVAAAGSAVMTPATQLCSKQTADEILERVVTAEI